jgi:AraC family transcriptional regulator, transcriptional activator of pobA
VKFLTWQNPEQLFVAQGIIKVKIYSVAELRYMSRLPIHRSSQLSDFGVYLKTVISRTSASSDRYAFSHTDDYYFFGFIQVGNGNVQPPGIE